MEISTAKQTTELFADVLEDASLKNLMYGFLRDDPAAVVALVGK